MTTSAPQPAKGSFENFPHLLTGTHWIEHLRDGRPVLIRPLRAEDREDRKSVV